MTLRQKAARMIRSLLRESRLGEHIVFDHAANETIVSTRLLEELAGAHVGDGTPDAALAIAEHAFKAGYEAACEDVAHSRMVVSYPQERAKHVEAAWGEYDPPEEIKNLA